MKFRYKKLGRGILRPIIPITLHYQIHTVRYEALVDSGADFCIFHAEIGSLLGLNIQKGKASRVGGITGVSQPYFIHPVTLEIGGNKYPIEAGFSKYIADLGHGVLGQNGFFELFVVKFDLLKEEVELKERVR